MFSPTAASNASTFKAPISAGDAKQATLIIEKEEASLAATSFASFKEKGAGRPARQAKMREGDDGEDSRRREARRHAKFRPAVILDSPPEGRFPFKFCKSETSPVGVTATVARPWCITTTAI